MAGRKILAKEMAGRKLWKECGGKEDKQFARDGREFIHLRLAEERSRTGTDDHEHEHDTMK